jgi:hypothetical protein
MNERYFVSVLLALVSAFLWQPCAEAAAAQAEDIALLQSKYRVVAALLQDNTSLPVHIEAEQRDGRLRGDVYATLDYPYALVVDALRRGSNWCEIAPLHLNVKACTHEPRFGATRLTFYSGRKFYQPPEKTRPFVYEFRVRVHKPDYFRAALTPDTVTRDTEQNRIRVEAIPLGRDRVLLHFNYSFKYSLWMRLAADGYFATLGGGKIGFSVTGLDRQGRPVHATGIRGAVERNAMRYYLALKAYLGTLDTPEPERFEQRLAWWFDLTEQYAAQLHELDRADYLSYKHDERAQQARLQRELDAIVVSSSGRH